MSTVYFPATKTANEWRELAKVDRKRSHDSFERCDTDGFLSQWANDTMAQLYETCADVADNDGHWTFTGLADLDGNLLDAREVETRYGWAWVITTKDGETKWFNPSEARNGERRRTANARKGYMLVDCMVPAVVMMGGSGKGLAGAMSVRPIIRPMRGEVWTVLGEQAYEDF